MFLLLHASLVTHQILEHVQGLIQDLLMTVMGDICGLELYRCATAESGSNTRVTRKHAPTGKF